MAILAECPVCHKKQSSKNKICSCGDDLVKSKRSKKVRYWITYRLPGGTQRKEFVGYSVEEARDAEGKRRSQKRENRIFDIVSESKVTFDELTEWYENLASVQRLASYARVKGSLANFNRAFGGRAAITLKAEDLENYQDQREKEGAAPATIDMEISITKTMVTKAFDNDKLDGRVVKAFRRIRRRLKKGSNARDRTLSMEEYIRLLAASPTHLQGLITVAFNSGMRRGELMNLRWTHIDREKGFIRLPQDMTKEAKPKSIPMNHHVKAVLSGLHRCVHHDFVFTYHGNPISSGFKKSLGTACTKAKIPFGSKKEGGFRFHDIRSTVKTNMLRAGVDKALRDTILGHSLQGMDAYYLKPSDEDLRVAMDRYTEWLDGEIAQASVSVSQNVAQEGKRG